MKMINQLLTQELSSFEVKTLKIDSKSLKNNPLKDPTTRYNPVLISKEKTTELVLCLSGFTSNGSKSFNFKSFQENVVESLDRWTTEGEIKARNYLFLDAWTLYGGSQFINSPLTGNYEDYIVKEVLPAVSEELQLTKLSVMGGSSGGYGALHLASKFPDLFSACIALSPDCDFELSLKNEVLHSMYLINKMGGVEDLKQKLVTKSFERLGGSFHKMINALAMAACYSLPDDRGNPRFPFNEYGDLDKDLWMHWLNKDPLYFLEERREQLIKLKTIYLSVGKEDQFLLQYGARKINRLLKAQNISHHYEEFTGNHFELDKTRKRALQLI